MKQILIAVLTLALSFSATAQSCTFLGQTPSTAFPVCGNSVFHQKTVPICRSHVIFVPGCPDDPVNPILWDTNPYWYKFTCYKAGSLGFLISPLDPDEDYDWQLFDITGHDPNDVFVQNLVVTGNWSGTPGNTGTSDSGSFKIECGSFPDMMINPFAAMPNLIEGHNYLLLVSHWSATQSGYDLSFGGGTAQITDSKKPKLESAVSNCGGDILTVKLNKKMRCNSIASDGSDFYITPGNLAVLRILPVTCSNGFDTDSVILQLATCLPEGSYDVVLRKGTDGNTLLDICDNIAEEGDRASFSFSVPGPTPMDSLVPLQCKTASLRLVFSKPILCSSIAPDGSDFVITGSYPVMVTGAKGSGATTTNSSKEIIINLSRPLYKAGSFTLTLQRGTDANTLVDECNQQTPAANYLTFSVKDTVNADFTYRFVNNCDRHDVNYFHPGGNGTDSWQWNLDENNTSAMQNPRAFYKVLNQKTVSLIVSNGFCSDTSSVNLTLSNFIMADFDYPPEACPNEVTGFTSLAKGQVVRHSWQFGDGSSSTEISPSHTYTAPTVTMSLHVRYTVVDSIGCASTVEKTIKVYSSCYLAVPNAFTPNGDGKNDYLIPLNTMRAENLDFKIYDRWGQLVFQANDCARGWDGTFKGTPQPGGVYLWFLTFVDRNKKETRQMKGTVALIR